MKNEQIRCSNCNKLLFVVNEELKGQIEIKCPRCNKKIIINK